MRLITLSLAVASLLAFNKLSAEVKIPEDCKQNGFAIGCQAWTFKEFTVFEAIEKTAQAGGKVIELFPKQKYSNEDGKLKFDHNATAEMIEKVKAKLKEQNVVAVNYGVVDIPQDEAQARIIFEFAKKMGLRAVTTEAEKSIDTIEKMVKEFDVMVAFHDHPKRANNPEYKMWDPNHVLGIVKDHDKRIGACADIGHWVRSGLDPIDCLKILKGRVVSSHLKDLTEFGNVDAHDIPYGTGVSKVGAVLDELKKQGFDGNISVEYEYNWKNNVVDAAQCIGFVRGYGAAKK
ncbi:MAG: Xylose isomerase domain protein barrel [Verrucomicrobiales bacterium]|nr:Xylose isomerase domain protein barrel [Verrucomicrobiales bacterium]